MAQDKNLACRDCGTQFVFTTSEQDYYSEKGFTNEPSRCPDCRKARKQQSNNGGLSRNNTRRPPTQNRELFTTVCAACGVQTQVPFRPSNDRPVYCRDCFSNQKNNKRY